MPKRRIRAGVLLAVTCTVVLGIVYAVGVGGQGASNQGDAVPPLAYAESMMREGNWTLASTTLEKIVKATPNDGSAWYSLGLARHQLGDLAAAIAANTKAAEFPSVRANALYNLACGFAKQDAADDAHATLAKALVAGYSDIETMKTDGDLDRLRTDPRFQLPSGFTFQELTVAGGETLQYAIGLPHGFDKAKPYPVLIGFPPGNQSKSAVETGMRYWWGEQAAQRGWVVVSSVKPSFGWLSESGEESFEKLLAELDTKFKPEGNKYHIAGCSGGATSSFHAALTVPERVHGLTGIPAHPQTRDFEHLGRLKDIRVRLFVGSTDTSWRSESEDVHGELLRLGVDSRLTVFPDEGHVMESLQADQFMVYMDELRREVNAPSK